MPGLLCLLSAISSVLVYPMYNKHLFVVSKCECISLAKTVTLYYTVVYYVWLRLLAIYYMDTVQSPDTCYIHVHIRVVGNVSKCECIFLAKTVPPCYPHLLHY